MNTPNQINGTVALLLALQAAGADVVLEGGFLAIGEAPAIPTSNIGRPASLTGSTTGFAVARTITATIAADTTYTIGFSQWTPTRTYEPAVLYIVTGASAPSATDFYAMLEDKIQGLIDGDQLLGTVSSTLSGTVFTPSIAAPTVQINSAKFTVVKSATTLTAAGSSATNAAPRVFTAGANHNLTIGGLYRISFVGVTGAGAADLEARVLFATPLTATTLALWGTSATGAVVTTAATITVLEDATVDLRSTLAYLPGYNATHSFIGMNVPYQIEGPIDMGGNACGYYACDITANTTANVGAYVNALIAALDGSNAAGLTAAGSF